MISHITTFAFEGVEAHARDARVQLSSSTDAFDIVGLADRAPGRESAGRQGSRTDVAAGAHLRSRP